MISIKKCHKTYKYGKTSKGSGALINILIRLFKNFNGDRSRLQLRLRHELHQAKQDYLFEEVATRFFNSVLWELFRNLCFVLCFFPSVPWPT